MNTIKELLQRPYLRTLLAVDFIYWMSFAVYQTTFALFGARRFGFDVAETGYMLSAFGFLGVIVQGGLVGPIVSRLGERTTLAIGIGADGDRLGRKRVDLFVAGVDRRCWCPARSGSACATRLYRRW